MSKLIYVADDEGNIRSLIQIFLENEGYRVETFSDGYSILQATERFMPDLIILDIMMPGEDGLSVCSSIRKKSPVPIIIVSAKDTPLDRVTGILLGSDDYITKPFLPLELTTRVNALFRRIELTEDQHRQVEQTTYKCGNVQLDTRSHKVLIEQNPISITPKEYEFLLYLFERKHMAVSKAELLTNVWNFQSALDDARVADDLIKRLRKKFREYQATAVLETVWGYGYRLTDTIQGGTV